MGHTAQMEGMKNAYKMFLGKPEGKRLHGSPRHTWENDIKVYLKEMGV